MRYDAIIPATCKQNATLNKKKKKKESLSWKIQSPTKIIWTGEFI
jgi:hypothetical protein